MSNTVNEYQVTCVTKPDRYNTHEHITHIGGTNWRMTREEAIRRIDAKTASFYTLVNGRKAYVGVYREAGKAPYLKTHADGYWNDNLLALAECNSACALVG